MAEGIMADLCRDFWMRETGMGQQVAQLHDRYMMMMMTFYAIASLRAYPDTHDKKFPMTAHSLVYV
jgi:hypothetical protein